MPWLVVPISLNIGLSPTPLLQSCFLGKGRNMLQSFSLSIRNRWQKDLFLVSLCLSSRFFPLETLFLPITFADVHSASNFDNTPDRVLLASVACPSETLGEFSNA